MITWTITRDGQLTTSGSADNRADAAADLLYAARQLAAGQDETTSARYRLELAGHSVAEIGIPAGSDRGDIDAHLEHLARALRENGDVGEGWPR